MNGKDVLHSFDLNHHHFFDKEIDTVTELNRNSIVSDGKYLFDLDANAEFAQFVCHADSVRPLQQSWPQSGMNSIGSAEDVVCNLPVNQMYSVSSVRVRVLCGSAFDRGKAVGTQRVGRL